MTGKTAVATNKPKLNAYVTPPIDSAIDREAKRERRSKSQMIEILLEEALQARGYAFPEAE